MKAAILALLLLGAVLSERDQIDPNPPPPKPEPRCVVVISSAGPVVICR